jgi:hypothetical protein
MNTQQLNRLQIAIDRLEDMRSDLNSFAQNEPDVGDDLDKLFAEDGPGADARNILKSLYSELSIAPAPPSVDPTDLTQRMFNVSGTVAGPFISYKDIWYVLITAFEGGSSGIDSWASVWKYTPPTTNVRYDETSEAVLRYADYPLSPGGAVVLVCDDDDNDPQKKYVLNEESILKGIRTLAQKCPDHYKNLIEDNHDVLTADALVQCALLGEVVYG